MDETTPDLCAKRRPEPDGDAGVFLGQRPIPAPGASAALPALYGLPLRDVVNDTKSQAFCGPTAVAAITGVPISLVRDAYRLVRHGPCWVDRQRAPAITSTRYHETEKVLRLLGFAGFWQMVAGTPTLAAFLEARYGPVRTHPCLVFVTGHVVAVSGWQFCDTLSKGQVVEADDAPKRRARVRSVLVLTRRVPLSEIPRKDTSAAKASQPAAPRKGRASYGRFVDRLGEIRTGPQRRLDHRDTRQWQESRNTFR